MWSRDVCVGPGVVKKPQPRGLARQGGLGSALAEGLRQGGVRVGPVAPSKGRVLLSASSGSCGRGRPRIARSSEFSRGTQKSYHIISKTYLMLSFENTVEKLKVESNYLIMSKPSNTYLQARFSLWQPVCGLQTSPMVV